MGGAGHVVPPPKGAGTMGIIMPIYTVGIVVFFMYTIMKVMFKKPSSEPGSYPEYNPDPEFRKLVFEDDAPITRSRPWKGSDEGTKLVATAISGLLTEVDQQRDWLARRAELELQAEEVPETETLPAEQEASEEKAEETSEGGAERTRDQTESSAQVQVVNMELTASCEGGQRWSRPGTPVPCPVPPPPPSPSPEPHAIFLEGALPSQSQLLVADSETQAFLSDDEDAPVILSGKVTLSLIGLDRDKQGDEALRTPTAADEAGDLGSSGTDMGEPFDNNEEEELLTSTPTPGVTEDSTGAVTEKETEAAVLDEVCVAAEVSQVGASLPATVAQSLHTELGAIEETRKAAHFLGDGGGTQVLESAVLKPDTDVQGGQDASKDEVEKIMVQEEVEDELEVDKEDVKEEQKFKEEKFGKEFELNKEEVKEDSKLQVEEATGYEKIKYEEVALQKEEVKEEKEEVKEEKEEVKEEKQEEEEVKVDSKADERKVEEREVEEGEEIEVQEEIEVEEEEKIEVEVEKDVKKGEEVDEGKVEAQEDVKEERVEEEVEVEEEEEEEVEVPVTTDAHRQRRDDATGVSSEEDSLQTAKETASETVEYEEEEEEEEEEDEEEEVEDEDEDEDDGTPPRLSSVPNCADETATTTNYTTASAAAEATNATGPEETAADVSALESIDPDDDNEDLGDEEEVWNGDLDSEEEEESEEEEGSHVAATSQSQHRQHAR